MTLTVVLPKRSWNAEPVETQEKKFQTALRMAVQNTRFYKDFNKVAEEVGSAPVRDCLDRLPRVELLDYLRHPERFVNQTAAPAGDRALKLPFPNKIRMAVLCPGFRETSRERTFKYRDAALARFAPQALAGPVDTLRALAQSTIEGYVWLPQIEYGVVAFSGILEGPISEADADLFWRAFKVPVFEQFRGFSRELLAWECEAHDGMHVEESAAIFETDARGDLLVSLLAHPSQPVLRMTTGLVARIDNRPCSCGRRTPRLIDLRRRTAGAAGVREQVRELATA